MSASPPTFNPAPRRTGTSVWVWIILVVVLLCLLMIAGAFFFGRSVVTTGLGLVSCAVNGEMGTKAVLAYAKDHDGQLPNAETWQDEVMPYYERLYNKFSENPNMEEMPDFFSIDVSPPGRALTCDLGSAETGFAYNSALSGTNIDDYDSPEDIVLLWETKDPAYNANGDPASQPEDDPVLKLFGDKRDWINFDLSGDADPLDSSNQGMDMHIDIDDAFEDLDDADMADIAEEESAKEAVEEATNPEN